MNNICVLQPVLNHVSYVCIHECECT